MSVVNTYQMLGDRAPTPCNIQDADAVAMAFMEPGTTVTPLPFKHPPLLPKELRIRVTHSGLCHSDILIAEGSWAKSGVPAFAPLVPGHEIIGVVEQVGSAVMAFREGDRVGFGVYRDCCDTCIQCVQGHENNCASTVLTYPPFFGGYATSFQARADFFYHIPHTLPGEAAPLFCAGLTVFAPLSEFVRSGMKVGVVGIGGLGHLGLKIASRMGFDVTAISTSPSKEAEARSYGASHFLNLKDPGQMKNHIRNFDFILNTATSYSIKNLMTLVKPRGQLHLCGLPNSNEDLEFDVLTMATNSIKLTANPVGSRNQGRDMLDFCARHSILPEVEIYPFERAQDAVNSLAHGRPHAPKYRAVMETASFFKTFTPKI
jgi:D-arabinose 1-dehydrogenase-like Zn-dependent alcohol dehydrogenase